MHIITKKVTLLPVPFIGTQLYISITSEAMTYGFFGGTLADGSSAVTVDWGDGSVETLAEFSRVEHTYAAPGDYRVRLSDDLAAFGQSSTRETAFRTYAERTRSVTSNAVRLNELDAGAFRSAVNLTTADFSQSTLAFIGTSAFSTCPALGPVLSFPKVSALGTSIFNASPSVLEIHFSKAHEAEIRATEAFKAVPPLAAPNATIVFDP